ncbi:MAG TPA: membrane dipeptidase [Desulfobacterales bacterium]|nr:membrane dipeptidase [Desulfobacterales bacterium]HIP39460.1 membrane dipeptidase [Desulfocapsa sulfexigens]
MSVDQLPLIFDGHNDLLLRLLKSDSKDVVSLVQNGCDSGDLDLPRMKQGGFGGGFFAIFVPTPTDENGYRSGEMLGRKYDIPLPEEIPVQKALPVVLAELAMLIRMERQSAGKIKICTTAAGIRECFASGTIAIIIHLEGAEAIDDDFNGLEVLYRAGLRSIGPVWSRPSRFGHGVPFRFPSIPDTGPGLTDLGKELVHVCNRLGMVVDLSHINEAGFWDIVKLSDSPLVATHSNVHAISPQSRNLTDRQLAAIRESNGIVGVNFATAFLRPDGQMQPDTSLDVILRHMDYLIEHVGMDGVGFGSDFDGAMIPEEIGDVAGLTSLRQAMGRHGYNEETMLRLCHTNWIRVLENTLKP